ncbi:hypothetical protein [Dokdonella sp.]|uniref:hypothetical protein n=1 Tax=Dokdonella sp. TaxID=2291710 RepID=UPI0037839A5A
MAGWKRACAAAIVLCGLASMHQAAAAPFELSALLWRGIEVDLVILADGKTVCTLKGKEAGNAAAEPGCRFDLAPATRVLQVRGRYTTNNGAGKPVAHAGTQALRLLDMASTSRHLLDVQRPYGERVGAYIDALRSLARDNGVELDIEAGTPVDAAAIAAAEKRLGFALPPEFVSLQRTLGAIRIGDHGMTRVASLRDAYGAIVTDWGTPESAMTDDYSPKMQELLRASTLLFTEVGDGLGGLVYRPPPTKACGGRGIYYWTSQEGSEHNLSANGACPDFTGAFRWLLEGFVVADFADDLDEEKGIVLVDSSIGGQTLRLGVSDDPGFAVGIAQRWNGPY